LSGDKVGLQEILDGEDMHENNRVRFNLPSRLIAKTFIFRLLFGGSAYAYANDVEFSGTSKSEKFWQGVIDETYAKYRGLANWHTGLMQQVQQTSRIILPSGREFVYKPEMRRGELVWPRTTILNYPVQSFSADLVQIARVSAWRRLRDRATFISTVHDDLELDVNLLDTTPQECYNICIELENVFKDVPKNVSKIYGYDMKVPMSGEVSFGNNLKVMQEFNREAGLEQFKEFYAD